MHSPLSNELDSSFHLLPGSALWAHQEATVSRADQAGGSWQTSSPGESVMTPMTPTPSMASHPYHRSLDRHGKLKDFHHLRQLRRDSMQSRQLNGWKKGPFGSLVDLCFHAQVVHHLAPLPAFRSPSTCKDATRIVGHRVSEHCLPQWLSIDPPPSDLFATKKPELNVN